MQIIDHNKQFYDFVIQDYQPRTFWKREEKTLSVLRNQDNFTDEQKRLISYFDIHWSRNWMSMRTKRLVLLAIGDLVYKLTLKTKSTLTKEQADSNPNMVCFENTKYIFDFLKDEDLEILLSPTGKEKIGDLINNNDLFTNIKKYQVAFNQPVVLFMPYGNPLAGMNEYDYSTEIGEPRIMITHSPNLNRFYDLLANDAMLIYQEIETWLSRQNPEPITTVGGDQIIAQSKGFDDKSFRKAPSKKK